MNKHSFFYLHCQKLGSWLGVRNVRVRANEASARDRHEYLFGLFPGHYRSAQDAASQAHSDRVDIAFINKQLGI
jgi:hypothetical protein